MIQHITLQFGDYSEYFGFDPEQHENASAFVNMIERVLVDDYDEWEVDDEISFTVRADEGHQGSGMTYRADSFTILPMLYAVLTRLIEEREL